MGQAKIKQRAAFAPQLIDEWEADDCVDFAVGLVRMTGWLHHVDWWSTSTTHVEDMPLEQLTPLRVYVVDNHDRIFDVRRVRSIREFNQNILFKLIRKNGLGNGDVHASSDYSGYNLGHGDGIPPQTVALVAADDAYALAGQAA